VSSRSLRIAAAASVSLLVPLLVLERRMRATGGPGIIPFELAGPDRSEEVLRAWGPQGRGAARCSLLLDFPYLVAYTAVGLGLTARARDALARRGYPALAAMGPLVASAQIAAGASDAVENTALLVVIGRGGDRRLAALARDAARTKFLALLGGLLYGAAAVLAPTRTAS
jgi:hypothetical protein